MTLLTVPSTQGSSYLHTEHIHRSLLRGEIITNCVVFAIIDFQLLLFLVLQVYASLSMMCFVYLTQSLLPQALFLLSPTTSMRICISCLQLWFACFVIWNWNCKVRVNRLSNRYFLQGRGGMSMTDMQILFKNIWPTWRQLTNKVWIDWVLDVGHPFLHEPVNSRHCYIQHGQTFCTAHGGFSKQVALTKTCCGGREKLCLVNKLRFIYTSCLYVFFASFHLPWCVMPMHHLSGTGTQNVTE